MLTNSAGRKTIYEIQASYAYPLQPQSNKINTRLWQAEAQQQILQKQKARQAGFLTYLWQKINPE